LEDLGGFKATSLGVNHMIENKQTIRRCIDLPIEHHRIITEYNKTAVRPVDINNVMLKAIADSVEIIKKETEYDINDK
jgi:hypothetical protein